MKIIVAEDQQLILKDLCLKIEKADADAHITATALNGKDALEKTLLHRPDILITDIRMPGMTGLELIGELRRLDIPVRTVIISGYKDFDYAREAIKLNVDEYLLKPLSQEDIRFVLQSLKEKISMDTSDYQQYVLEELLRNNAYSAPKIRTVFPFRSYCLMMTVTGSFPVFSLDYMAPNEPAGSLFPLPSMLEPFLQEGERLYLCPGKYYNESICVFCLNDSDPECVSLAARRLLEESENTAHLTICISRPLSHVDSIGIESHIMRRHLADNLVFGASSLIYADVVSVNQNTERCFLKEEVMNHFLYLVQERQRDSFCSHLQKLFVRLRQEKCTQRELSVCLKKLFSSCFSGPEDNPSSNYDQEIDEYLTNSRDYGELLSYLTFLTGQLFLNSPSAAAGDSEQTAAAIRSYMEEHYMEDINVNEIACAFSITPSYLSRLFKKHTGKRPLEYLTGIRIFHACDYFIHTDMPVKEVGELCGYTNPFHFSKAFKSAVGLSPSAYRVQNRK